MGWQLSLFPDPLDHDCRLIDEVQRRARGWRGRFLRWRMPENPRAAGLHCADAHAGTGVYPPAWMRVLCDPRVVIDAFGKRLLFGHVRFDGSPSFGHSSGLELIVVDLQAYARRVVPSKTR